MMGKATKSKKIRQAPQGMPAKAEHPMIAQADIPNAQRSHRTFEVARVPNPLGEAVIGGEVRQHKVVRVKPSFQELFERRVFDRVRIEGYASPVALIMAALEWYDQRLDVAQSGMVRCGIAQAGSAGGGEGVAMPSSLAAMEARSDVAWTRGLIPPELLPAFDAVMIEQERFAETARRQCANRYVRVSVERQRKRLAEQFNQATAIFAEAWGKTHLRQRAGIVASSEREAA